MLFSEPKIPQCTRRTRDVRGSRPFQCSSASRKFLNPQLSPTFLRCRIRFQCSSASRKFLNLEKRQRRFTNVCVFQCSSASRKFLNRSDNRRPAADNPGFSALQRAENSSIVAVQIVDDLVLRVSVLFSEPKIPQYVDVFIYSPSVGTFQCSSASRKFLNLTNKPRSVCPTNGFSALQRAENSSIITP